MSVNLGNTTPTIYSVRPTQSQIVKASDGTLVLVANVSNDLVYKTSDDDGATWDSSWTNIHTTSSYINDFDVYIDGSNNIHIAFFGLISNSRIYYQKLSYSGGSWSVDTPVLVQAGSSTPSVKFAVRSNGDFWIASTGNLYYSTNSGSSWNSSTNPGSSENIVSIIPYDTKMWLIAQRSGGLYYYEYDSSWGSAQTIASSGITNNAYSMGVVKISDSNIWVTGRTSSGIKVFHYTSSWDSGTLLSDNANDTHPCLSNVESNPVCVWKDYSGTQYDIVYRIYNGASWDSVVNTTNDATEEKWPTVANNDSGTLYFTYLDNGSSPYAVTFDKVAIANPEETITVNETVYVSDDVNLNVSNETIEINETVYVSENIELLANVIEVNETVYVSDENYTEINKIEINETVYVSDETILSNRGTVEYASKILSYNPLLIVTDTNPAKIIEVDISNPASPDWSSYILTGCSNANNVSYNSATGYIYVVCDSGKVSKILASNLSSQLLIDTLDTDNLLISSLISNELKTFASSNDSNGEIILIDEASVKSLNCDIRFAKRISTQIPCWISTLLGKLVNCDIRFAKVTSKIISTDIRFLKYSYETVTQNPINFDDIQVKIDGTDLAPTNDIDLQTIVIIHNIDSKSTASFRLNRQFDNLDKDFDGNNSEITDNNEVEIYINGNLEFSGKVSNISADSETESVIVTAQMDIPQDKRHTVSLPLASVNEQLNIYHALTNSIIVDNPYIASDEEEPEYYKGVKIDLGTYIKQEVKRFTNFTNVVSEINDGDFQPKTNFSYFWLVSLENFINGDVSSLNYIGTSLGPLSSDTFKLLSAYYSYQRQYEDIENSLGYYYLGNAPYLEVSSQNGQLVTAERWEDRDDGLYVVKDDYYDYRNYARKFAQGEFDKMKNINGDILPITSADISLSIDAYYYYNLALLTRLNITNTTISNLYNKNNGFPVSIKSITLRTSSMTVELTTDNALSTLEQNEIDEANNIENVTGDVPGYARRIYRKYNPATGQYVV